MSYTHITNIQPIAALTERERQKKEKRLEYIKTRYNYLLEDVFYYEEKGKKNDFKQLKKCMENKSDMMLLDIERQDIYEQLNNQTIKKQHELQQLAPTGKDNGQGGTDSLDGNSRTDL